MTTTTSPVYDALEMQFPDLPPTSTKVLMCEPTHYGLEYEINPWMSVQIQPDIPLAKQQWQYLYETITQKANVEVELIPQAENCPDMVFTANAGLVRGHYALLANFRHPQRQLEEPFFRKWFEEKGYKVQVPSVHHRFEGEGDALFAGETLVAGYLKRSDIRAHHWMAETLSVSVLSLQLTDERWYHLDTCFFALDAETVVYHPGAFDSYAVTVIEKNFETIIVNEAEALRFACNSVVLGKHIIMPSGCPIIAETLQNRGYNVHTVEMSEFLKAGGAAKCLSLILRG